MSPRAAAALVATSLVASILVGCSTDPEPTERAEAPSSPATASVGPSASASAPAIPAGSAPERTFALGVRKLKLNRDERPLPVTIWYPAAGQAGGKPVSGADAADGKFPVIMFSHGLGGYPEDYATLLTRWAAAGFVVAAPTFPHTSGPRDNINAMDVLNQPADVSYALTQVLALDTRDGDPLRGRLVTDRAVAAGHSAGGVTTIGLFTTGRDLRLAAGIVLSGTAFGVGTAFAGVAAPQLFVHGEADEVVQYAAGKAAYDKVPWPKAMLSLPDGDHGRALLRDGGAALRVVTDTTIEFLRWTLYGDAEAKERISTAASRDDIATLDNQL
ncbi:alpha/beta hydrolase family protein [Micromonospora lutea]|uniref:Chlorophyllase n=1 Tax=Micromonospora lutea TaxID=419825 RepID=A0ABQ4IZP9_9ACTN|nr:chlorophyllase [Micromonospora lutea]GIJ23241.1 hypothetical protein Vlu01_38650 [Micromonospora lutea]